jgi:hypothetical protein
MEWCGTGVWRTPCPPFFYFQLSKQLLFYLDYVLTVAWRFSMLVGDHEPWIPREHPCLLGPSVSMCLPANVAYISR